MAVRITYFVHGTTTDNEIHASSGWKDVDLSELGVQQSLELPIKKNDNFEAIFCSDLTRAIHSAELSFKGKFPIIIDKRLRECNYGDFNGQLSEIVEPLQEKMITDRFPNGESYEDVKARILEFLTELKMKYEGKNIAIVAHKAPQLALDVILKGLNWEQAFANDWRKVGKWQPGWAYTLN
jgi:alpha-ribazole phosphatase/probable phosphoglycerate mutase